MPYFPPDGGGGGAAGHPVAGETLTGAINGTNKTFTISHAPVDETLKIYFNGSRQKEIIDFTISGVIITFVVAPLPGDILLADYNYISV